jgi:hypothetical protein
MKRFVLPLAAASILALLLAGCATVSSPKGLSRLAKIGVTSVTSNDEVTWYGEQGASGLLVAAANLAASSAKKADANAATLLSRADVLVVEADAILRETLAASKAGALVPKDKILATAAYAKAKEKKGMGMAILKPADYKFIDLKDTALAKGLAAEAGVDGSVLAFFQFNKVMKSGVAKNGAMGAFVMLNVQVLDATGKMVFSKSYSATGSETLPVVAGIYDVEKLKAGFAQTTKAVCEAFASDLAR